MLALARQAEWSQVPHRAQALAEKHAATAAEVQGAIENLPREGFLDLWRDDDGNICLNVGDWIEADVLQAWRTALEPLCDKLMVEDEIHLPTNIAGTGDWVKIAFGPPRESLYQVKHAYSQALQRIGQGLGFIQSPMSQHIPGFPGPLASTLAGGLVGAGLGYGAGWLGEQLMPEQWERGRLRKNLALAGGAAGTVPGLGWMVVNNMVGKPWNSPHLAQGTLPVNKTSSRREKEALYGQPGGYPGFGQGGTTGTMPVALDDLSNTIYRDPRVAGRLTPQEQVGTTALFESAYAARGGGPRLVTPVDVAKITAGMGTGYLSGMLVGKALGVLTGMPPKTQDRLKSTGMWAGVVSNLIPLAFGR